MAQYHTNSPYHKLKDEQYGGDFLEKEKRHYRGIQNLDKFLCQIYGYFLDKGYKNIILSRLLNILTAMWVVALVIFLTSCVDYDILFKGYQFKASLSFQGFHPILTISLVISGVSFLWKLKEFVSDAIDYWEIRTFYLYELKIDDAELATIEWREVAKKLTEIPNLFRTKENLSVLDIANRIMRKENYMIALINRDILKLGIPLPFLAKKKFLTKTIEWGLSLAVLSYVFDYSTNEIDPKIKNPTKHKEMVEGLRKRCFYLGLLFLLVSPFMFVFVLTYFIFQHGEEIRSKPAAFAARQWSPLARWKFRELNELPHIFMKRLQQSYSLAEKYVNSFPDTTLATIAKFISFIVGSVVVILLAFGVVDDDFLTVEIFEDKSALWVIGVGGAIVAVCRALIPDENAVFEPEKTMEEIVQHTHYFPKSWRGKLHTLVVLGEFAQLFEYKVVLFIAEVISVLFGPFILMFSLPGSADKIIQFFRQYTVHVDSVGDVCKFAVFPLDEHGNKDFGVDSDSRDPTKEGKLEKSFLNFKANYPDWKPSRDGERYLMNLDRYISSSSNQTVPIMSSMMLDNNNMASPMESIMERNRSDLQQSLASLNHIHRQFFRAGSIPTANNNIYP